ncbi:MAG: TraR/DksA family transcriptional regulator [Bacteroidetes bacterium]|nr:TraR/DksA family transcriptional regulator [Bacteroidota bacterium]
MATKKKAAKPAAKKASKPIKSAPKKPAPAKKPARPTGGAAKPAAKKAAKPAKPAAKAAPKKAAPAKKAAKPAVHVKPVSKTPVPVKKPDQKSMAKKVETKKPEVKPAPAKATPTAASLANVKAKDIKVEPARPVVLPKINTTTSRKYQPDFTKSVLDQPKNDPGAPIVRYSDADLNEFKELIQRKLESAKKELAYLQGLITRKDEMGGDNDDARYMTMEDGSMSMEREQLSQMASRQITFIDHLEKALMRIENKTYGICRVTGKLIDKARLRAVPHATLSIEAKMGSVK